MPMLQCIVKERSDRKPFISGVTRVEVGAHGGQQWPCYVSKALRDLPFAVAQEHLPDGFEINLKKKGMG